MQVTCSFAGNVIFKKSNDPTTQISLYTPPKFNIDPEQMVVGRLFSYWNGNFSGSNKPTPTCHNDVTVKNSL